MHNLPWQEAKLFIRNDDTNIEKVNQFLDEAKIFYFLTTDGDKPKGRPFGFHMLDDGKLILDVVRSKMFFHS